MFGLELGAEWLQFFIQQDLNYSIYDTICFIFVDKFFYKKDINDTHKRTLCN